MTTPRLFLAPDWRDELCLWETTDHPGRPRLVHRESDLDPLAWAIVVLAVGMPLRELTT